MKFYSINNQAGNDNSSSTTLSLSLQADGDFTGTTINVIAGENIVFGDLCFLQNGKAMKVKNRIDINKNIYLALQNNSTDESCLLLTSGTVRNDIWSFTSNENPIFYINNLTDTIPTTTKNRMIGTVVQSNIIRFEPSSVLSLDEIGSGYIDRNNGYKVCKSDSNNSSYLEIADADLSNFTNSYNFSIETKIKFPVPLVPNDKFRLASKYGGAFDIYFSFYDSSNTGMKFYYKQLNSGITASSGSIGEIGDNNYHTILMTFEKINSITYQTKVFVDKILKYSGNIGKPLDSTTNPLKLFEVTNYTNNEVNIAYWRYWDKIIDINETDNAIVRGKLPNLICNYNFDGNFNDESGNYNNLVNFNNMQIGVFK